MLIAVPSNAPGGLDAEVAEHFGHCHAFTLVRVEDGQIGEVVLLPNQEHEQGGCLAPVTQLKQHEVDALVAGGMGMRPLAGFQQAGITVFHSQEARDVRAAVQLVIESKAPAFGEAQTCGGGGDCGGHHHHGEEVVRDPIVGPADVREGRVVTFHYQVTDEAGTPLDASRADEPMRYLHGRGNLVPGLERALVGLEAGAETTVTLTAAEGYGERDEDKVVELPLERLPPDLEVGTVLQAHSPDGRIVALSVVEVGDKTARLDHNHPLAGKNLVFSVTIVGVESATAEELAHGHAH